MQLMVHGATVPTKIAFRILTPNLTGRVVDAISESFGDAQRARDPFTLALKLQEKDWRGIQ